MATPRLPFLYPNLMRAVRSCEPTTYRSVRIPPGKHAAFHTSRRHEQETYHRRYGPAAEANLPPPPRSKEEEAASQQHPQSPAGKDKPDPKEPPKQNTSPPEESRPRETQKKEPDSPSSSTEASSPAEKEITTESKETRPPAEPEPESESQDETAEDDADVHANADTNPIEPDEHPIEPPDEERHTARQFRDNPLEGVLHMPSPSAYLTPTGPSASGDKPPHLSPAPYVHHFDTYSLVRDLSNGGFGQDNAVTIMKAVRLILQNNIDLAKQSLTSKSDVENETYLFKAACSELQSSLRTARNSEMQRQRASRTQLQHEIDILSQRLNQELAGLKDDIKGMFNDHKMTTREHQRSIDTSTQELNYKITVSLNSDGKSEIEGLRWILTRRAAFAVATSASKFPNSFMYLSSKVRAHILTHLIVMIILFLKYYSVRKTDNTEKKERGAVKEIKETRIIQDAPDVPPASVASGADVGEILG